jgi:hypothetical protein
MGLGISVQSNTTTNIINSFNSVVNNVTNSAVARANITAAATNITSVEFCTPSGCGPGAVCQLNGGLSITQVGRSTVYQNVQAQQDALTQISTDLKTQLTQTIMQSSDALAPSWFSIAFGIQINDATQVQNFVNKVVNNAFNNVTAECSGIFQASNNARLVLCGTINGGVVVGQDSVVIATQSCVSNQVAKAFLASQVSNDSIQQANQSTLTGNSPYEWIGFVIIAIVLVIFIIVVIYRLTRQPKPKDKVTQPTTTTGTNSVTPQNSTISQNSTTIQNSASYVPPQIIS